MRLPIERQAVTTDPSITTTITPSSSATAKSTSILAEAAATTDLSWWQLLCIVLGGVLALLVGIWGWWRHRKKVKADKRVAKGLEKEEREKKLAELVEATKRAAEAESDSDSETSESEDYDSVSDGGTIRPRRRRVRRRRRRRDRDYSDSEDSDDTYAPRRRRRRDEYGRRRDDYRHRRERPRPRDRETPSPVLRVPPLPVAASKKRETFRDSVFSSYTSMKKAAVRLKYVEAKAKLKKELEKEEEIEQARQRKIREANAEIQREREWEALQRYESASANSGAGGSGRPLIPPVRPGTGVSGSSERSAVLPTPPPRAARRQGSSIDSYMSRKPVPSRQASTDSHQPSRQVTPPHPQLQLQPSRQTTQPQHPRQMAQPEPSRQTTNPHPLRQNSNSLDDEITQLLGASSKTKARSKPTPKSAPKVALNSNPSIPTMATQPLIPPAPPSNSFQADWLSHPIPAQSVPQSPRTASVYLPVPKPQDRPTIPKGGLAPAPPGKAKLSAGLAGASTSLGGLGRSDSGSTFGASALPALQGGLGTAGAGATGSEGQSGAPGPGGSKWASRLRERK